jgi:hypothetical protein
MLEFILYITLQSFKRTFLTNSTLGHMLAGWFRIWLSCRLTAIVGSEACTPVEILERWSCIWFSLIDCRLILAINAVIRSPYFRISLFSPFIITYNETQSLRNIPAKFLETWYYIRLSACLSRFLSHFSRPPPWSALLASPRHAMTVKGAVSR